MARRKILYIVSQVHKSLALEWTATRLNGKYDLQFILLNPGTSALEDFLLHQHIPVTRIPYRGKKDFLSALAKTIFFIFRWKPHVVHAHLLDAQLIGLSSAWLARVNMRLYTRHNSNYHHVYQKRGVRYDTLSNRLATGIISISQATDETLVNWEHVPTEKIIRIPHGFDLLTFEGVSSERISRVRTKWSIPVAKPVIGVIARHIEWKGIQYIIPAFLEFSKRYPESCLVLANASGPFAKIINEMLEPVDPLKVVRIPFEEDIAALYSVFDLFVHVPVDQLAEAYGQTYVEALASGIPSVFTRSGIAAEFIEDRRNALLVPFRDSEAIAVALIHLWSNEELQKKLILNGRRDVISRFGIDQMLCSLEKLYDAAAVL